MSKTKSDKYRQVATGWNDGLCQDYDRKLFQWFASRIDARWVVRNVFNKEKKTQ